MAPPALFSATPIHSHDDKNRVNNSYAIFSSKHTVFCGSMSVYLSLSLSTIVIYRKWEAKRNPGDGFHASLNSFLRFPPHKIAFLLSLIPFILISFHIFVFVRYRCRFISLILFSSPLINDFRYFFLSLLNILFLGADESRFIFSFIPRFFSPS